MSYIDVKNEISRTQEDLIGAENSLRELRNSKIQIKSLISSLESSREEKLNSERASELEAFNAKLKEPFDASIRDLNSKKLSLKSQFDSKLSKIVEEVYRKRVEDSINVKDELARCEEIKSITSKFYGDEFTSVLRSVIPTSQETSIFSELSKLRVKGDVMSKSPKISLAFDKAMETLEGEGSNEKLTAVVCLAILATSVVFYPVLLVTLVTSLFYNVYKSKFFIECISSSKAIESDISTLKKSIEDKIQKDMKNDRETLTSKYNLNLNKCNSRITKLENDKLLTLDRESKNFHFSPSNIIESFELRREDTSKRLNESELSISTQEKIVNQLGSKLEELKIKLNESLLTLTEDYMPSTLKQALKLPDDYLIDIKNAKPILLGRPRGSSIFIYKSKEDLDNFIVLIFYQTILRTSLDMVKFTLIDLVNVGRVLKEMSEDECLQIVRDFDEVSRFIEATNEEMKLRLDSMGNYLTVDDYNSYLIENDCPPLNYNFIFNLNPDLGKILSADNKQLLLNGSVAGYFEFIFISDSELNSQNKSKLLEIFDSEFIESFYILSSKVDKRSRDFILDKIESLE